MYVIMHTQNKIGVRILGHGDGGWYIEVSNKSNEDRIFEYAFETTDKDSARNFGAISKVYKTKSLKKDEKQLIWIEESGSYITISYAEGYKRYIFYGYDLTNDNNLSVHENGYIKDESVIIKNNGFSGGYYSINVENHTGKDRTFYYNDYLCRQVFAENWGDCDINYGVKYIDIKNNESADLNIRDISGQCFTISYIENNVRHIYYANDLHKNHHISTTFVNEVPVYESYDAYNKMSVSVVGKNLSTWLIALRNTSGTRKEFSYFKTFTSYNNLTAWSDFNNTLGSVTLNNNETKILEIKKSDSEARVWFGISYLNGSNRNIFIGSNLSFSSPIESNGYTLDNSFKITIISKSGTTWNLNITNNTGAARTIYYNSKMCFEGDAKNWDNLTDVSVLKIGNGANKNIQISENGMATSIGFCYINGNTRHIYYGTALSKTGGIICYRTSKTIQRNVKSNIGFGASIIGKNGSKWLISITNNTGASRSFDYNSKMCFESDARDWNNICDIKKSPTVTNSTSLEDCIEISENGLAGTIAISYLDGNTRKIFYAYNLSTDCTLSAYTNTKDESFKVDVVSKSGNTWNLKVTNKTGARRLIVYNSKMCFEGDAKNWSGLTDARYLWLANNDSTNISISENGTARYIVVSYINGSTRYILYANGIYSDGRISSYRSSKSINSYTRNGIKASILGKNGSKWLISLTNDTGAARTISYNSKMCFEGDAKSWSGLSDTVSISLSNSSTVMIEISENGLAGTIAISYLDGNTRKIFYAYNLSTSGTMSAYEYSLTPNSDSQCVAKGTLITLADGTQKKVEDLTGDEFLLAWNLETGTYETVPVLFIDSDAQAEYEVIMLTFSDNTKVDVISEHGFFDITLGKYVYLDKDAAMYIGHKFLKQSGDFFEEVTLTDVEIANKVTTTYSPVTYGTLCYFVNGMLSMPGGITGLFNYFEVDTETIMYDKQAMEEDIEKYGLLSYEELSEFVDISEEMFDAVNGKYLNIALGKGLLTMDDVMAMAERYSGFVPGDSTEDPNVEENIDAIFSKWLQVNQKEIVDVINEFMQSYTHMYWMKIKYSDFSKIKFEIVDASNGIFKATFAWGNHIYTLTMKGNYK